MPVNYARQPEFRFAAMRPAETKPAVVLGGTAKTVVLGARFFGWNTCRCEDMPC